MILRDDVFDDVIDLKALFFHFLMMGATLIMSSGFDKISHMFEYSTESLFFVS